MRINYILAILALISGITALFTNYSEKNNLYPSWKYRTEKISNNKIRLISANHLADLVANKERGMTIIDARTKPEYDEYHIPGAIPYSEQDLLSASKSSEKVILYGDDKYSYLSAIPADLRKKTYNLNGGINEWLSMILFPDFSKMQVRNKQILEKVIEQSRYFGGTPQNAELLNISTRTSHFREGC